MKRFCFAIIVALVTLAVSCAPEDDGYLITQNTPIRSQVKVTLDFVVNENMGTKTLDFAIGTKPSIMDPEAEAPQEASRAGESVTINTLHVFQFSSQGLMFTSEKINVAGGQSVEPTLTTGLGQIIYIVANAGAYDFSKVTDLASFESLTFPMDNIASDADIPLVGCVKGVDIEPLGEGVGKVSVGGQPFEIAIKKILSKVVLTYNFDVADAVLSQVVLADVPTSAPFVEPAVDGVLSFFPEGAVATNFTDNVVAVEGAGTTSGTLTWYVSDNIRGAVEEFTEQSLKNPASAPEHSTHIKFSANVNNSTKIYHYSLYVGEDNCGDFNVYRGNTYNITANIDDKGTEIDRRIEVETPPVIIIDPWVEPANCYMVAPGEEVVIGARKVVGNVDNDLLEGKTFADAVIVWQTKENDELALGGADAVAYSVDENGAEIITVKAAAEGNALVAVRDAAGEILWSWHIWVTAYNPEEENFVYNNTTFMNRSLGALNYRKGEARTAGWLYQWGRKDPFPPTATEGTKGENAPIQLYDANGTLLPAVDTNSELDSQIPKADVGMADSNLAFSIANPYTFIYNTINKSNTAAQPIHWITSNANSDAITASLWSGVKKTVYDPCPAGWQVSATNFWTNDPDKHNSLTYTGGATTYDADANGSIVNVLDKESVWFPFQGYRKALNQGVQGNCGDVAVVWSVNCHADALRTWAVKIRAADYRTMIDYPRADGLAVRCVKIAQ